MEGQIAKFIIPMLKNQTVNINQHYLILVKDNHLSPDPVLAVNFQPFERQDHLFESIIPHFNHDMNHFSPAFVLPRDQKFYKENINFEKLKFDERIQNAQEKNILENNYNFTPSFKYCQLCKLTYDDYQDHTASNKHLHNLTLSPANLYISELVAGYVKAPKAIRKTPKPKKQPTGTPKKNSCEMVKPNINGILTRGRLKTTYFKTSNQSTNILTESV